MKGLLEKAPHNKNSSELYDEILEEYDAIRIARNDYVHGLWYTQQDNGRVLLARYSEHGWGLLDAKEEPVEALDSLNLRIRKLWLRLMTEVAPDLHGTRHLTHPQQSDAPSPDSSDPPRSSSE